LAGHFLNISAIYKYGTRWAGYLPVQLTYALSQGIASLSYVLYKTAAHSVKENLRLVFPETSDEELSKLASRLFRNYSKYLVDYGRFTSLSKDAVLDKIVFFDGKEHLERALQMKKGLILLTAHLGNWELGGIFFGSYGIKTNVVTIQDKDTGIDDARKCYRERHNVSTITIGNSPFSSIELVNALRNQEIVAMLIDRYSDSLDGDAVPFFGRNTTFPRGPFILSRFTEAPIIVAFVVKDGDKYKGIIEEPFVVSDEKAEFDALREVVKLLEKYIRQYPDQWYNFAPI
jgi:lauroyl/myristoyl acyltransferase